MDFPSGSTAEAIVIRLTRPNPSKASPCKTRVAHLCCDSAQPCHLRTSVENPIVSLSSSLARAVLESVLGSDESGTLSFFYEPSVTPEGDLRSCHRLPVRHRTL